MVPEEEDNTASQVDSHSFRTLGARLKASKMSSRDDW